MGDKSKRMPCIGNNDLDGPTYIIEERGSASLICVETLIALNTLRMTGACQRKLQVGIYTLISDHVVNDPARKALKIGITEKILPLGKIGMKMALGITKEEAAAKVMESPAF